MSIQNRLWGQNLVYFWSLSLLLGSVAWASDSQVLQAHLPQVSTSYVLDEPRVLKPKTLRVLHQLLHEHDQATGEQVVVGVFQSLQGQDLVQWTNQIFQKWELGQKEKDNGVLLALFWQDQQMRLEVGYGLESELTDAQSKLILSDFLKPLLKAGHPDDGIIAAILKILDVLESPLVENGRALEILKSEGITEEQLDPSAYSNAGVFYLLFLIILIVAVIVYFSSLDRHISEKGLHHALIVPPFFGRKPRWSERPQDWDDFFRGGGGTGGWGGGTFSGGGGSSGGGGASENGKYPKVVQSIQDIELRTTGEIHVHLSRAIYEKDPFEGAQRVFARYSMQRTQDRNAILIYINEKKRRFAIIGDIGIHQMVGQKYWNEKSVQLQHYIQTMDMDSALSLIVVELGNTLEQCFPLQRDEARKNQISDEVTSDS